MYQYKITNHLRERFIERKNKKFEHLHQCKTESCSKCMRLAYEIRDILNSSRRKIDEEIFQLLDSSQEDRSYLNNTQFMARYYEKYGYDHNFKFMVNGPVIFVCVEDIISGVKVIPTCLCTNKHIGASHKKFKKKLLETSQ